MGIRYSMPKAVEDLYIAKCGALVEVRGTIAGQVYSAFHEKDIWTGRYWDFLALGGVISTPKDILLVGMGAGTAVRLYNRLFDDPCFDAVEINPKALEIARDRFDLHESERLHMFLDDGVAFLEKSRKAYDIILVDTFLGYRIPEPFKSREFFTLTKSHLKEEGVLLMNTLNNKDTDKVVESVMEVFPSCYSVPAKANRIVVAPLAETSLEELNEKILTCANPKLRYVVKKTKLKRECLSCPIEISI